MSPIYSLWKIMRKITRYYELLRMTWCNYKVLFHEYKARKFHPQYLNELLSGKYVLFHPERIMITELGQKNKHKVVAYITLNKMWVPTAGFFALLHKTLCGLYFADKMGFYPVVANWDACAYEEEEKVNGTKNVFEYYFQPVSRISVSDALNSNNVVIPSEENMNMPFYRYGCEWFHVSDAYIENMGVIFRKYIRRNDRIRERMERDMHEVLGNRKSLAIHFRGTDYKINANGHPVSLELEDYYSYIVQAMKKHKFEQIFVATDDSDALKKIKKKFKNIVCYQDTVRTDGNVSVAFLDQGRKRNSYELGYEVLRDAYTLAACDGLIAGGSQVAVGARLIKASTKEKFQYCKIIEKGINRNQKDWMKIFYETVQK